MTKGIFIVGTDTDVGKTIVSGGLTYVLRSSGYNATYFKAALSGALEVGTKLVPGDTELVSQISGLEEAYENMTPYVYKSQASPHLAAKLENNPMDIEVVKEKYEYLKSNYDFIVAEGSGGIACPLVDDESSVYLLYDLIKELGMSVIVVASSKVGTINHTVLTVNYLESLGIKVNGIIINNYKDNLICNDNIYMIEKLTKVSIIGKLKHIEYLEMDMLEKIRQNAKEMCTAENIIDFLDILLDIL